MKRYLGWTLLAGWPVAVLWLGIAIHATIADPSTAIASWAPDTAGEWFRPVVLVLVLALLSKVWLLRVPHPRVDEARRLVGPRSASARTAGAMGSRARRQQGLASRRDIGRAGSRRAARSLMRTVRPSLRQLPWWRRATLSTREVAVELCRVGGRLLYASIEDVVCVFGGPRAGKTGWIAGRIIDAPGAVVVTSTRVDLLDLTAWHRERRGPVWVFNAAGVSTEESTAGFDPLTGCTDPAVAQQRADDMIPKSEGDKEEWAKLARQALASLMHAAALGGRGMAAVRSWVADPVRYKPEIISHLQGPDATGAYVEEARNFLDCNDRTRSSITTSVMPALAWLNSPAARAAARPGTGFDVEALLAQRGTLYILGSADTSTALMAGLAGYIAREARRLAAGRRLDPNLTLALDEAALIAPPIPDWTADMGGAGVTILACFQSRADLVERWGKPGAARILNNSRTIMLFGGTKDSDDLQQWVELFGKRDERVETTDEHGRVKSATERQVPVLSAAQLASMPKGTVAVHHRGMPPAIGRPRMAWQRWDLRAIALREWLAEWRAARHAASTSGPEAALRPEPPTAVAAASVEARLPEVEVTRAGR